MDIQQILNNASSQQFNNVNPMLWPRKQIDQVEGQQGANNLLIGPDSSCLALDTTKNLVCWFIQTDAYGKKTAVAAYKMTPYVPEEPPDFNKLQTLMESMAEKLDTQSAAFDDLTRRVQTMEEALK